MLILFGYICGQPDKFYLITSKFRQCQSIHHFLRKEINQRMHPKILFHRYGELHPLTSFFDKQIVHI